MLRISDVETYININTEVVVLNWDGEEVVRCLGKDTKEAMEEIKDSIVSQFWVAQNKLVIEVY